APTTLNCPATSGSAATAPADVWPLPQSILAVKSSARPAGLASVKVATTPANSWPRVARTGTPLAVSGASATAAVVRTSATTPPRSPMVTLTVYPPARAYVAPPRTSKWPAAKSGRIVPAEVWPSPQSMAATKSPARLPGAGNVNDATRPANGAPSVAVTDSALTSGDDPETTAVLAAGGAGPPPPPHPPPPRGGPRPP